MEQTFVQRFIKHKLAMISLIVLFILILLSVLAPLFSKIFNLDYKEIDLEKCFLHPSSKHIFGTDDLGHDLFIRMLYGGRVSLSVALVSALISTFIGVVIGIISGYYAGLIDEVIMRFVDTMLSLPVLAIMILLSMIDIVNVLRISFLATIINPDILKIIIIIVIFGWMGVARIVRGCTLSIRETEYIEAIRASGQQDIFIIFRHILPNVLAPAIVAATLQVGGVIISEAVLSYLGLGIQPPTPSWGNILQRAQEYVILGKGYLLAFLPGFFIFITVTAFNFLGDGLRDTLDVKTKI
ncbi:MAG: ABC transporter permease [Candidatus Hydrogenedentota bacterium]